MYVGQRGFLPVERGLVGRAPLDGRAGPGRDRVDPRAPLNQADVDGQRRRDRRDHAGEQPRQLVHGAGPAAVPPRVPARAGHREPHPHRADGVREHAVGTVAFQRQHRLGRELAAGVAGAAQSAETLLADGEDDRQRRFRRAGERALGHGHGGRDRDRVVADPRAAQPAVAPRDTPRRRLAEDVIDVNEDGEPVRRRAERPHQVAGLVDVPAPRLSGQAPLQPVDAYPLVAGAAGQFGQRRGIRGDCPGVESPSIGSRVSHVTLARRNSYNHADRASVPSH